MATDEDIKDETKEQVDETAALEQASDDSEHDAAAAKALGAARYVHAAFFLLAILGAYVFSKVLVLAWGALAEWPAAVRAVPQIVAYAEDQREGITLVVGAAAGTIGVVQGYFRHQQHITQEWQQVVDGTHSQADMGNARTAAMVSSYGSIRHVD